MGRPKKNWEPVQEVKKEVQLQKHFITASKRTEVSVTKGTKMLATNCYVFVYKEQDSETFFDVLVPNIEKEYTLDSKLYLSSNEGYTTLFIYPV